MVALLPRAMIAAWLVASAACFAPHNHRPIRAVHPPTPVFLDACQSRGEQHDSSHTTIPTDGQIKDRMTGRRRHIIVGAALLLGAVGLPSASSAAGIIPHLPSPNDLKAGLVSILDNLSHSGTKGMVLYTLSFIVWTMTAGITTPVETAAGMAFPLQKSIPLSAIGKIGGAFFQYTLAKYLFSDLARKKLEGNEWMDKINVSFEKHPYRVALIWRFSPLPEFVKNVGPALVPTLRTRYQLLAILTHGLPFTVLWSCMGSEAARVARGGQASVLLKRMVAVISWVGLFVSPTAFGWWIKGLGGSSEEENAAVESG
ncbi:hypothetical protein ACHAXT_000945 [Thalassiosira profunda]